jgi:hypothetical protein
MPMPCLAVRVLAWQKSAPDSFLLTRAQSAGQK